MPPLVRIQPPPLTRQKVGGFTFYDDGRNNPDRWSWLQRSPVQARVSLAPLHAVPLPASWIGLRSSWHPQYPGAVKLEILGRMIGEELSDQCVWLAWFIPRDPAQSVAVGDYHNPHTLPPGNPPHFASSLSVLASGRKCLAL